MTCRLAIFVALFAAAIVVPGAAATQDGRSNARHVPPMCCSSGDTSQTYIDPEGDSGEAPDISRVSLDYQGAGGYLGISVQGGPAYLSTEMSFHIYLDTDMNPATGDSAGADYVLVDVGAHNDVMHLERWTGSAWDSTTPQTSLHYNGWFTGGTPQIKPSDLGGTKGFNFWFTTEDSLYNTAGDLAPDAGLPHWTYTLPATPPGAGCVVPNVKGKTLSAAKTRLVAAKCRLGKVRSAFSRMKAGRVISQSKRAGTHLALAAKVNVVLSRGHKH